MFVLFICGSLEAGKDGVGDYTRRLAGELMRQGNKAAIIALNDGHIETDEKKEFQFDCDKSISVLRLSGNMPFKHRMKIAAQFVEFNNPEWISLQFVPFSFHPKGLPFKLAAQLKQLGKGRKWHIMFHELWVGINNEKQRSFKDQLLQSLQKYCIIQLINKLNPNLVTTSIEVYKEQLRKYNVHLLPLFSNIPFTGMQKASIDNSFQMVTFGTLSGDIPGFKSQLNWLINIAATAKKNPSLLHIGSGGPFKDQSLLIAKELLGSDKVVDAGICSVEQVSAYFSHTDAGISRADGSLWGKSGTTVAMLEHGLPVVLKGERKLSKLSHSDNGYSGLLYFSDDPIARLNRSMPLNALSVIANNMLTMLHSAARD